MDILKNVNDEWLPLDILIYSPTIEGGVNFNLSHFDKKIWSNMH
jgi:hypothetical protein